MSVNDQGLKSKMMLGKTVVIEIHRLIPANYNPRKISPTNMERLKKSLERLDYFDPIIVNKDLTVISGHQRLKALKDLGYEMIEVRQIDVDKETEKRINIAANSQGLMGEWDSDALAMLLKDVPPGDLDCLGFSKAQFDHLMASINGHREVGEGPSAEGEEGIKEGDTFTIGNHTLICGNSLDPKYYQGVTANLCITDPPYNVNLESAQEDRAQWEGRGANDKKKHIPIASDHMSKEAFDKFLDASFKVIADCLAPGSSFYCFTPTGPSSLPMILTYDLYFHWAQLLIWKKKMVMSNNDFKNDHEGVLYGWKEGASHTFLGSYSETTVMEAKQEQNPMHPTQKPIALVSRFIELSSKPGDMVLDPFGGSGTTAVAAEALGRKSLTIELDPYYCSIIKKRLEAAVGGNK